LRSISWKAWERVYERRRCSNRQARGSDVFRLDDVLAVEEPLEIRLGGKSLTITMRTPGDDIELAVGFLFSEGIIRDASQVHSIDPPSNGSPNVVVVELASATPQVRTQADRNFVMTSACGVCGKASLDDLRSNTCPMLPPDEIQVEPELIHVLPDRLRRVQSTFDSTGGLHAAALFSLQGELGSVREDVGRHNALDKLIGAALLNRGTPLKNLLLLVRASFELVQKALMAGLPVLAAVGAPSSLAVSTAESSGMTLIGFLRNGRFNVYTGSRRVRGLR
jgi:FdhD protein